MSWRADEDHCRVADLQHDDETVEYGRVVHREGRKVWFDQRIVTFPTLDDKVSVHRPGA